MRTTCACYCCLRNFPPAPACSGQTILLGQESPTLDELGGIHSLSVSCNCFYYLDCSVVSEQLLSLCFRSLGSSQIGKHGKPDKQTAHMSGRQLEAWWALSPEDLAIVQADPAPGPTHLNTGTLMTPQKLKPLPRAMKDLSFGFAHHSIPYLARHHARFGCFDACICQ